MSRVSFRMCSLLILCSGIGSVHLTFSEEKYLTLPTYAKNLVYRYCNSHDVGLYTNAPVSCLYHLMVRWFDNTSW